MVFRLAGAIFLCLFYSQISQNLLAKENYQFDSWTIDEGLPQNSVRAIIHPKDGYLWLGTYEGLVRFDGVNFTVYNSLNTPEIKNNFVKSFLEDRKGNLWIGFEDGLVKFRDNKFTALTKADGLIGNAGWTLLEDHSGNIWVGSHNGITVLGEDFVKTFSTENGLPSNEVWALSKDEQGTIWIGTNDGLVSYKNDEFKAYTKKDGLLTNEVRTLFWDKKDGLFIGTKKGLNLLQNDRISVFGERTFEGQIVQALLKDDEENLWIGTYQGGLYKFKEGEMLKPEPVETLAENSINTIYKDNEGNLWIGGQVNGLNRYRRKRFHPIITDAGVEKESTRAIFEDRDGNFWFGGDKILRRLKDGKLTSFTSQETKLSRVRTITQAKDGAIWMAGGGEGVSVFKDNKFKLFTAKDGLISPRIYSVYADRTGRVWIGAINGVSVYENGKFTNYTSDDGLVKNGVISIFEDLEGTIWLGSPTNGISRYKNGKFINLTTADGLSENHVLTYFEEPNGTMWFGTSGGGLNRLKDGKITSITSKNGLFDNLTFAIIEDRGNLWMCGNKGVYRANLQELNDFADGLITSVRSFSYDKTDGMLHRECNGSYPAGFKTSDGTIWFATAKGPIGMYPNEEDNYQPPQVIIEEVRLNNQVLGHREVYEINSGQENFEIQYTGISWERPKQVRFRYQLEGFDKDWIDVGTRRTVYFQHLPPGEFIFRVIAENGDGVWNSVGKSLKIIVYPPFYQTWWFWLLLISVIGFVCFMAFRLRINQLEKVNAIQNEFSRRLIRAHEIERHRIARELHDGLGQSLSVIKNTADFGITKAKSLNLAKTQLGQISDQTVNTLNELREIAYNLRPFLIDRMGLTEAIKSMLRKINESGKTKVVGEIDEIDGLFDKDTEISIYRILQECFNNILKHSQATETRIYIKTIEEKVNIIISDNGNGFLINSKEGGFGLMGIAERVKMIGGSHSVKSAPGEGTTVKIDINLAKQ